jgi:hypothetical protein
MDGAHIPLSESMEDWADFPFRMTIERQNHGKPFWIRYVVNLSESSFLEEDRNHQDPNSREALHEFARGIGVPSYESDL